MLQYLKNRLSEKSTAAGLSAVAVSAACVLFPEYAPIITQLAALLGVSVMIVPTGGGKPK